MSLSTSLQWLAAKLLDVVSVEHGKIAFADGWQARAEDPDLIMSLFAQPQSAQLAGWAAAWGRNGMPQVEVGHKLAASLMATTMAPEATEGLALPWSAFRIVLPVGLLASSAVEGGPLVDWVTTIVMAHPDGVLLSHLGEGSQMWTTSPRPLSELGEQFLDDAPPLGAPVDDRDKRCLALADRMVLGVLAELGSPDGQARLATAQGRASTRKRTPGSPPRAWTFVLKRDVRVDARGAVRDYVAGSGTAPSVQVLVRGHWKRQRHGERHSLTKWIHVEPYWRGPEDAPIAVRAHRTR